MDYYTFITAAVQNRWNLSNVRGFMILSLCMQLILSIPAPLRQKTSNRFVIFLAWSSYLMADWSALFVFGLISNSGSTNSGNNDAHVPLDVMALWAGFLLVLLGGPDTITAFSLEDNALWLRHLVGLVAQLSVFLYIFMKTLPNNRLLVPTVLMFVAGMINYGERTRALYLASLENLKTKSTEKTTVPNLTKEGETFHQIAYGLVSDIMPDLQACNNSRHLIFKYNPEETFKSIKSELNVLYELLYTKAKAATSNWGILARGIIYYSTQVAFILFCLADKHGFHGVDLAITYALFVGVFVLHEANTILLGTTASRDFQVKGTVLLALEQGIFPVLLIVALGLILVKLKQFSAIHNLFNRRWSEKMGSVNMLSQCFKQCGPRRGCKLGFIWNKLVGERRTPMETTCDDITLDKESFTPRGAMCKEQILVGERHTPRGTMCEDITLVGERHTPMETTCEGITLVGERRTPMGAMCEHKILVGERRTPMETTCEGITLDEERHTPMETTCEGITLDEERHALQVPMDICGELELSMAAICPEQILGGETQVESSKFDDAMRFICEDIKGKAAGPFDAARMRELYDARGDRALEEINCRELMTYIRDFEYENTLLIWHIATEICINIEGEEDNVDHSDWKRKRKLSKKLSDYLMYLLVRRPKLMSAVAGISQIRYKDTCVELKCLGRRFGSPTMREFCASIVQEYANITESSIEGNNHVHSVLNDSCWLVRLLLQRGKDDRWDAIHMVWLELLSYAAGHCRVDSHLQLLSEGGEFLTFVWMLMAFCGIRDQLPVKLRS